MLTRWELLPCCCGRLQGGAKGSQGAPHGQGARESQRHGARAFMSGAGGTSCAQGREKTSFMWLPTVGAGGDLSWCLRFPLHWLLTEPLWLGKSLT